ncbi:DUF3885 domain-containing protein [Evansella clarkii]|uniref:DUF3885 domain-containing protein n=1 Tax=Evansella clarkii TaxID=79879 RepID=UPI000B42E01F|nr:DUF3885 domain-containing protein [Evansella clarkii]
MNLSEYLNKVFPGLSLKPSLYNQWKIGIHFELGQGLYQFNEDDRLNHEMFERVYSQALCIFNSLFSEQDEIFLVTNVYHRNSDKKKIRPTKVYYRFLKNKDLRFNLEHETLPSVFDDEEKQEEYYTSQFHLKCKKRDLNYTLLIKAICNKVYSLNPKLGGKNESYPPDVFFVNTTKNIILFIYDDRGCEVIADETETINILIKENISSHRKNMLG